MKKLSIIMLAVMLVCGFAGQAMAAYTGGELLQFIYEGTTDAGYEFNTSLGSAAPGGLTSRTITAGQPDIDDYLTSDWDELFAGFATQASETVQVGAYPFMTDTTKILSFATTSNTLPSLNTTYFTTFSGNAAGLRTVPDGRQLKAEPVSYWETIENLSGSGNIQGVYAGFNANPSTGYAGLGILDDNLATGDDTGSLVIGRYVDMYLWQFAEYDPYTGSTVQGFVDNDGVFMSAGSETYVAMLRIGVMDDGEGNGVLYTEINPVPVPGAVLLFGSGLLALFGIRRRNA